MVLVVETVVRVWIEPRVEFDAHTIGVVLVLVLLLVATKIEADAAKRKKIWLRFNFTRSRNTYANIPC